MSRLAVAFFPLFLNMGCRPDQEDTALVVEALGDCNPVDDSHCMLPFPSAFFLQEDATTTTGYRVALGETTLPINRDDVQMRPDYFNEKDGFSTLGTLFADLPEASLDGVIGHTDLGAYADTDARTVIVDVSTGEWHPHFVEREVHAEEYGRDLLMLHPVSPMQHATWYVVGIRGLVDDTGGTIEAPAGFASLRDGAQSDDPAVEAQRDHYDNVVFPALEAQGFSRDELQLAWSFVTVSVDSSVGRGVWMRDDALERLENNGGAYTIAETTEEECGTDESVNIGRTIIGTIEIPHYLTEYSAGAVLSRDNDGWPSYTGMADVSFTLQVPCSLIENPQAAPLMQYGHGLFGGLDEAESSYLGQMANDNGWSILAMDWTGMTRSDAARVALMLVEDPTEFVMVPERVMQAYVEWIYGARVVMDDMAEDEALMVDAQSLIDPEQLLFYGNSQGGILGGGYLGLSPDVDRGVIGVGGTPFTLLVNRSVGFSSFLMLLETMYDDWADITLLIGSMQTIWDPGEAAGYAWFVNQKSLDDATPPKEVLLQAAIGDASVSTLGAHVMARSYGASLVDPPAREVWGLEMTEAPFYGSALVEFDWGVEEPVEAIPVDENETTHDGPRHSAEGIEQIGTFLREGLVTQTCDGACDPN